MDVSEEQQKAHLLKTRRGLLEFLAGMGGIVNISELHTYSEATFFVGHKKFSDLMVAMVSDGVILHDDDKNDFHLTEKGRLEISA